MNLLRELAGRSEDERPDATSATGSKALKDGQRERRGFTGAGLGERQHVSSVQAEGDRSPLDGRGRHIAEGGDPGSDLWVELKRFKVQRKTSFREPRRAPNLLDSAVAVLRGRRALVRDPFATPERGAYTGLTFDA